MKLRTLSFFIVLLSNIITAQNYIYKQFGCIDGLPSLQVYDMYQDDNGVIWFGTDKGLANYNSYEIKKYGVEDGILNNVVLDFYPQKDGTVYAVTLDNRLFSFKNDMNGFKPYTYNSILQKELKSNQLIKSFHFDAQENLHIGSEFMLGKLIISKEGKLIETPYKADNKNNNAARHFVLEHLANNTVRFHYDTMNNVLKSNEFEFETESLHFNLAVGLKDQKHIAFTNNKSVFVIDKKGNIITKIKNEYNPISIKALDEDHFFVGYYFGGGIIYDSKGNIKEHFLKGKSISNYLIDNEGGYWFSTLYSGVYYIKEPQIKKIDTLIDKPITSIVKSNNNELYVGYDSGDVLRINSERKITTEYESTKHNKAFVEYDSLNAMLYVNSGRTFYKKDIKEKKYFFNDYPYALKLSESIDKKVLQASNASFVEIKKNGIHKINTPFRVEDVCVTNTATYLGTHTGAYIVDEKKELSLVALDSVFKKRIDDIDVNSKRNEVYFGTLGEGVVVLNEASNQVKTIGEADGLFSNIINELHVENENELWVCTNSGLNKIKFNDNGTFIITGLKSSHGLLNDGISDVEIINDTVWIASKSGLLYVPKDVFEEKEKLHSNFLRIKEINVNDKPVTENQLGDLAYTENRLSFNVEGISFKYANKLLYGYSLDGLDDKWYYTTNRTINYSSLPYGKYTFKLAAVISEKDEKLGIIEIPICIYPPLWKRTWFVIAALLSFIFLIYLFFKYRILSYNRHIISELLRLLAKKVNREEQYFSFKEGGKEVRVKTNTILYVKSSGNYIELVTEKKNYIIRTPIRSFIENTPDPLEYIRIHRSYVVRIDKVTAKNNKEVVVNKEKLPVSSSYLNELDKLIF